MKVVGVGNITGSLGMMNNMALTQWLFNRDIPNKGQTSDDDITGQYLV